MSACKILIVEDELLVATDIEISLQRAGHEVVGIAEDYTEALALTEKRSPDVVLMDIQLRGELDGVAAAAAIRERWQTPVIFLTANADEQTLENARTAGPFGFLTKPFRNEELLETIRIAISQSQTAYALFASHRWLTTVLDSLTDAVIATDPEARVRYLNPAAEALTKWTPVEANGREIEEVYPLTTFSGRRVKECLLKRALKSGHFIGKDRFILTTKTGEKVVIEDSAAPIRQENRIVGAVTIFVDIADRLAAERRQELEKDRLEEQAFSATEALGQTRAELRELAANLMSTQEQERRRIARDLHDDLGQQTALLDMEIDQMTMEGHMSPAISEKLRAQIGRLSRDLREISHKLHPTIIADLGLAAALRSLVEQEQDAGRDVILTEHSVPVSLSVDTATALYRIAQEALHNAAKHAPEATVHISLSSTSGELQMRITDNGPGFSPVEVRRKGGLGLVSMQERARLVGGNLLLTARAGGGAILLVRVPIRN